MFPAFLSRDGLARANFSDGYFLNLRIKLWGPLMLVAASKRSRNNGLTATAKKTRSALGADRAGFAFSFCLWTTPQNPEALSAVVRRRAALTCL